MLFDNWHPQQDVPPPHTSGIKEAIQSATESVTAAARETIDKVRHRGPLADQVAAKTTGWVDRLTKPFAEAQAEFRRTLAKASEPLAPPTPQTMREKVMHQATAAKDTIKGNIEALGHKVQDCVDCVKEGITNVGEKVRHAPDTLSRSARDHARAQDSHRPYQRTSQQGRNEPAGPSNFKEGVLDTANNVRNYVNEKTEAMRHGIDDATERIKDGFRSVFGGSVDDRSRASSSSSSWGSAAASTAMGTALIPLLARCLGLSLFINTGLGWVLQECTSRSAHFPILGPLTAAILVLYTLSSHGLNYSFRQLLISGLAITTCARALVFMAARYRTYKRADNAPCQHAPPAGPRHGNANRSGEGGDTKGEKTQELYSVPLTGLPNFSHTLSFVRSVPFGPLLTSKLISIYIYICICIFSNGHVLPYPFDFSFITPSLNIISPSSLSASLLYIHL